MDYYFAFPIEAIPKGRPRFSRSGHAFTPTRTRKFEAELGILAKILFVGKMPLNRNLEAIVAFEFKKPKSSKLQYPGPDLDNLIKAVLDSLNGIVYVDDKQIVKITSSKTWATEDRIVLTLTEI